MTIRDRVKHIERELIDTEPTPETARKYAMALAALMGPIRREVTEAEIAYFKVEAKCFAEEGKANRAKMRARTSDEHRRYREAEDLEKTVDGMIITARRYLSSLDSEMRLAR